MAGMLGWGKLSHSSRCRWLKVPSAFIEVGKEVARQGSDSRGAVALQTPRCWWMFSTRRSYVLTVKHAHDHACAHTKDTGMKKKEGKTTYETETRKKG